MGDSHLSGHHILTTSVVHLLPSEPCSFIARTSVSQFQEVPFCASSLIGYSRRPTTPKGPDFCTLGTARTLLSIPRECRYNNVFRPKGGLLPGRLRPLQGFMAGARTGHPRASHAHTSHLPGCRMQPHACRCVWTVAQPRRLCGGAMSMGSSLSATGDNPSHRLVCQSCLSHDCHSGKHQHCLPISVVILSPGASCCIVCGTCYCKISGLHQKALRVNLAR